MSGATHAVESAASATLRGFESIPERLKTLAGHVEAAVKFPFTPEPVKQALPMLLDVLSDLAQEIAEQRKPCPCEPVSEQPAEAAPTEEQPAGPTPEEIEAKVAAFRASLGA